MPKDSLESFLTAPHSKREFLKLSTTYVGSFAMGISLYGCGGGSNGSSTSTPSNAFSGVPVQGLAYSSKSNSGMTESSGTFKYASGEAITFSVGNVVVGTLNAVPSDGLVTTYDLVGQSRKQWWQLKSIVIAQFLQSIHSGSNQSFIDPVYEVDAQGNTSISFKGRQISIPQSCHDNLKNLPLTYLNDPSGNPITQVALAALVASATGGKKSLVNCVAAETNQIFYPS